MGKTYIHYGATELHEVEPIQNERFFSKPKGGLWASPVDAKFGWDAWCKREHFRNNQKTNSFKFVVKDESKIIHIYSVKDLDALPKQKSEYNGLICTLDFEKIEKDYDGIELHLSDETFEDGHDFCSGLYFKLYGWDCDSILIFHDQAIEVVS